MRTLPNPNTKKWLQMNLGDAVGTLWSSFNLNLTQTFGKTKVSPRMVLTNNNTTDLGTAVNFKIFSGNIFTAAGLYIWKLTGTKLETLFAKISGGAGDPSDLNTDTDIEVFDSKIWATGPDKLYFSGTGATATWSFYNSGGGTSGLTGGVFHKLLAFQKNQRMYITDSISIKSVTAGTTTITSTGQFSYALNSSQLGLAFTSILQTDTILWLLTTNSIGDTGYVICWGGITANTPQKVIPLDSRGALAGIIKDGTPFIMTVDGRLQYYNGGAFVDAPFGRLPVSIFKYLKNPFTSTANRWIHPNGMTLVDGRINILINNENYDNTTTINENLPSGIWEYDPEIGWYHKNSLSQYDISVGTVKDFGQNRLSAVGALCRLKTDNNSSDSTIGTILAGGKYFSDATTVAAGIWTDDSKDLIQKYGYLTTSKMFASDVVSDFDRFFLRLKKLLASTDRIVFKYRNNDYTNSEVAISWISTTGFTTTSNVSGFVIGDEVEITQGTGGGKCSHIIAISATDTGYMVEVDETYANASGTARARFQKWKKFTTLSNVNTNVVTFGSIVKNSSWVQFKLCMLFTGNDEIFDLIFEEINKITT